MLVIAVVLIALISMRRRPDLLASADSVADVQVTSPIEQYGDAAWQQRVLAFALDLRSSLTNGQLHETIANKLPAVLGVEQLWIETTIGGRRKVIASPIAGEGTAVHPLIEAPGEWATFPLTSTDGPVGVIGVPAGPGQLTPAARRAVASLAPLLGDSLQTAHTIAQLRELSTIDSVTGCSTRPDGLERLRAELKRAHRANQQVAVLMLDLDYFKSINDRYGHPIGDEVLCKVAKVLLESSRKSDSVARYGGDEFVIMLPETTLRGAEEASRRIRAKLEAVSFERAPDLHCTVSLGAAEASAQMDVDAWVRQADDALYRAKLAGRNRFEAAAPLGARS